jgi:hypothetical protein
VTLLRFTQSRDCDGEANSPVVLYPAFMATTRRKFMASAFKAIGDNIKNAVQGIGKVITGALTLDLKTVGEGLTQAVGLGDQQGEKAAAARSSNTMMDNAMEKMMGGMGGGGMPMNGMMMMMAPELAIPMQVMAALAKMRA